MKAILEYMGTLSPQLEEHPLCRWITSGSHVDARRNYDCFVPALGFIMTFPFYNERFLSYRIEPNSEECAALRVLRETVNAHAEEDRTHARLFLHDAHRMDLGQVWGVERPGALLWALWLSPMLDESRSIQSERLRCVVSDEDEWPPYRYLHAEQIEQDGHAIFAAAATNAVRVQTQTGFAPVYFGKYHLDRESGHVGEEEFEVVVLSEAQSEHARRLVDEKHGLSLDLNDVWLDFAQRASADRSAGALLEAERNQRLDEVRRRIALHRAGGMPAPAWHIRPPANSAHGALVEHWATHHAAFLTHPFAELCRDTTDDDLGFTIRCWALLLSNRICAMHTFYADDCHANVAGNTDAEQVVKFIGNCFRTEADIFMHDWDVLQMDTRIPWDMPDTLQWWFLDKTYGRPEMEALHEFRYMTLRRQDDPVVRYWAIMAIHFMSRAFFENVRPLVQRFSAMHPELAPLVYLEGTHHLLYDTAESDWADPQHPTSLGHIPLSEAQRQYILEMMDQFAAYGRRQFDNLVRATTTDRERFAFLGNRDDASRHQCPVSGEMAKQPDAAVA